MGIIGGFIHPIIPTNYKNHTNQILMSQLHKINPSPLRISHQSEVLQLRRALAELQAEMKVMKEKINAVNSVERKINLSSNGRHYFITLNDILYCEAYGNYTKVFVRTKSGQNTEAFNSFLLISKTLKSIAKLIYSKDFIRCHQSYLVNKNHITNFETKGGCRLKMLDQITIPVSRRSKKMVFDCLTV